MGHVVTIEGGPLPSVDLPAGARATVEMTVHIRRLVRIGAVTVVEGSLDAPAAEPAPDVDGEHGDGPDDDGVPARNASTKTWRQFVLDRIPGVTEEDVADKGRDTLIAAWTSYEQQVSGGS